MKIRCVGYNTYTIVCVDMHAWLQKIVYLLYGEDNELKFLFENP